MHTNLPRISVKPVHPAGSMWASTPTTPIRTASVILSCSKLCGKSPENPKWFFWSVQGGPEGNRNPSGLVFFCQRFLLEKQKKMLDSSCNFLTCFSTLQNVSNHKNTTNLHWTYAYRRCQLQSLRHFAPTPLSDEPLEYAKFGNVFLNQAMFSRGSMVYWSQKKGGVCLCLFYRS